MKKKMSRLFSGVLAAVMAVGMLPAYAELDVGADVEVVDNKGTSQAAVIDSAPAQFNVIVPTKLPFAILANNETLKATNAAIKNQGNGPVKLTGITAEGKGWAFADYDSVDFNVLPMNSKIFTMELNGDKVPEAAVDTQVNVPITQSAWASGAEGSIYGKSELPVSYDGQFAPQADAADEAVVAHVVFTIGWQTADEETSEPQIVEGEYGDFAYRIKNNKATITGLSEAGKTKETITEMPDSIDGIPVTAIAPNAFYAQIYYHYSGPGDTVVGSDSNLALTSLPTGLTSIGDSAFEGCINLALTSLPSGVTSIGEGAFCYCTNLALTSLPDGVTSIGAEAFNYCTNITGLTISPNNANYSSYDGIIYNKDKTTLVLCPAGKTLVEFPDSVTSIGDGAFESCTNLALTSLPSGVTSIGEYAFSGCTSLVLASLPKGLTSIEDCAFRDCTNLALTSLPAGVTNIGNSAFCNCENLALTSLPDGVTSIGICAFCYCSNLALTSLPDGVTSIGNSAFRGCPNVNIQTVPCSYGENAFEGTKCENPVVK